MKRKYSKNSLMALCTLCIYFIISPQIEANEDKKLYQIQKENKSNRVGYTNIDNDNKVYDLCLDREAIKFGMDGGDLAKSRESLGIECGKKDGQNRFGIKSMAQGKMLFSKEKDASERAVEIYIEGVDESFDVGFTVIGKIPESEIFGIDDSVSIVLGSINTDDATHKAIGVNTSDSVINNVKVRSRINYQYPLSIQPGEYFPFEYKGDITDIKIDYKKAKKADRARFIRFTGTPGFWDGEIEDYPFMSILANKENLFSDAPWIYTSSLAMIPNHKLKKNGKTQSGKSINNLKILVSHFDEKGRVLDVQHVQPYIVFNNDDDAVEVRRSTGVLSFGEELTFGVVAPANSHSIAIWAGSKAGS
jgi:hypothetical protein